jgi:hypothetical protein
MRFLRTTMLGLSLACSQAAGTGTDGGTEASGPIVLRSLKDLCDSEPQLTGNNVLSLLRSYYGATFTPTSGSPSTLELFITTTNAPTIICHPHVVSTGGPPDVPASIDVGVQATFTTTDKMFNESFGALVTLNAGANGQSLAFLGVEPVTAIQGTFQPAITGTWTTHDLSFGGTLLVTVPDGGPGTTNGLVEEQASGGNAGKVQGAGSWN